MIQPSVQLSSRLKEGTSFTIASMVRQDAAEIQLVEVLYKNYVRFENLPLICQTDETRAEFEAYKRKFAKGKKL